MSHPKRIIVTGGRDFDDAQLARDVVRALVKKHGRFTLVHGGCRGADALAVRAARRMNGQDEAWSLPIAIEGYPADWIAHGKAAGPIRNQAMVDAGAVGCVAFPGGRGTADMVRRCKAAGIPVWEVGR